MGMVLSMWAMTAEQIAEIPNLDPEAAMAMWTSAEVSIELWSYVSELFTSVGIDGNDLLFGAPIEGGEFFEIPPFAKDPNDVKALAAKLAAIDDARLINAASTQTGSADNDYSEMFEEEADPDYTVEAAKEIIELFQRAAAAEQHILSLMVL